MDFKYFVCRYSAFLAVVGLNTLTKDLYACIARARNTDSDDMWRVSASMLIDIVSLTTIVLNMAASADETDVAERIDVFCGMQLGKTQVFLRAPVFELLERLHLRALSSIAFRLQRRRRAAVQKPGSVKLAAAHCVMHFAFGRRVEARKCVSATVLLQRRVRVFLTRQSMLRTLVGITMLKALYRGWKSREFVRNLKFQYAQAIQKTVRRFLAYTRYRNEQKACIYLQARIRCHLEYRRRHKKMRCILKLQCLWRGTQARIKTLGYRLKLVSL